MNGLPKNGADRAPPQAAPSPAAVPEAVGHPDISLVFPACAVRPPHDAAIRWTGHGALLSLQLLGNREIFDGLRHSHRRPLIAAGQFFHASRHVSLQIGDLLANQLALVPRFRVGATNRFILGKLLEG
jgi:hypothetical protein